MQRLIYILFICLSINSYAQSNFSKYLDEKDKQRQELWQKQQYKEAIDTMLVVFEKFNLLKTKHQSDYIDDINGFLYNLACGYSLINDKENSIKYLEKAIDYNYNDYYWIQEDSDLDNIRNEAGYLTQLSRLKEIGDYKVILKRFPEYSDTKFNIPQITYQSATELSNFKTKYKLDSIAGSGDEFSKMLNLMSWVHNTVRHDGSSSNPTYKSADSLITICKRQNRGVNCRMLATILNEAYLAMGFKSRFVTCMPKGNDFDDCHVINSVYSTQYNNWIWIDPSFEVYVMDENNIPLSIQEVRERLINDKPLKLSEKLNWNGKSYSGGEKRYLHQYMAKNLYRFSTPAVSCSGYETKLRGNSYIELYPLGYNPNNYKLGKKKRSFVFKNYYITNADLFWN